jgi:hypothetical protein
MFIHFDLFFTLMHVGLRYFFHAYFICSIHMTITAIFRMFCNPHFCIYNPAKFICFFLFDVLQYICVPSTLLQFLRVLQSYIMYLQFYRIPIFSVPHFAIM